MTADVQGKMDVNPSLAIEKIDSWIDGAIRLAPNMVIALIVFALFFAIGIAAKKIVASRLTRRNRVNLGEILGGFLKSAFIIIGLLVSVTIVAPTLSIGDLVAGLGVSAGAIGFAFKDILQNWLAGLLILLRQPFEVGDQIEVGDYEGTVMYIETRATIIKTYDGQKAVIPNSDIYTGAVLVKTAYDKRRSQYDIGIGYGDDIEEACEIIKRVLHEIEGIKHDPEPEALPWDLAPSWVTVRARWWTDSSRSALVNTQAQAIMKIKYALDDAGIDMPYDTKVHLFHDQTDERDGIPGAQREGWPAKNDASVKSRFQVEKEIVSDE
ncbi:MAG: mechanosensitive ion channel family protein [Alphaproteobacteria bacterium]|nr:mechanosensitive ion channel family protein [Alphaproteobacteria bacterium]